MPTKIEIVEYVRAIRAKKKVEDKLPLATISNAEADRIQKETGIEVKGLVRVLDISGVNHAFKRHGDPKKEAKSGQIAITPEDFALIPTIVKATNVTYVGQSETGLPLIRYEAEIGDLIFYTEEVRKKHLCVHTMWKRKKKKAARP